MSIRNNKKVIFGAISGIVASVTAGVLVKNSIDKKLKSEDNDLKEKKQKKEKDCHTGKPPCFLPVRSRKKMKRSSGLQNRSKKISMETEL